MDNISLINLPNSFLWAGVFAFILYGFRYIGMAAMMLLIARPTGEGGLGRVHEHAPKQFDWRMNIKRELMYSMVTVLIFAVINSLILGSDLLQYSLIYFDMGTYPIWWFGLSIVVMLVLHDTFFYW